MNAGIADPTNDEELVAKLVRILDVNGMIKVVAGQVMSRNIYLQASLLNHSCRANVVIWHTKSSVETIQVGKLLRKVEKGEELTMSYYSFRTDEPDFSTRLLRKEKLLQIKGFECLCDVCKEENIDDEKLRKEFQQLMSDYQLSMEMYNIAMQAKHGAGVDKFDKCFQQYMDLLAIAKRKLVIAKIVNSYAVYDVLVLCWQLSQVIAVGKDQKACEQVVQYKKEVDVFAKIFVPEVVEATRKLEQMF